MLYLDNQDTNQYCSLKRPSCALLQYDEEAGNEAFADDFQQAMTYFTKLSLKGGEVPLKDAYSWSKSRCIMDVGGGRGEMLSHCMLAAGEHCKGVLMDRPWVLDRCALLCRGCPMHCKGLVVIFALAKLLV